MKSITLYQIISFALSFTTGSAACEIARDLFDGSCGSNTDCLNVGECCSQYGFCGIGEEYCGVEGDGWEHDGHPTELPTSSPVWNEIPTSSPVWNGDSWGGDEHPTTEPTPVPTPVPTPEPTPVPTPEPTPMPSPEPTKKPSKKPRKAPTKTPTKMPSPEPTGWKGDSWGGDEYPTEPPTGSPVWEGDSWSGDDHPSADKPSKNHGDSSVEGLKKVSGMLEYVEGASSSHATVPGLMLSISLSVAIFSVLQ